MLTVYTCFVAFVIRCFVYARVSTDKHAKDLFCGPITYAAGLDAAAIGSKMGTRKAPVATIAA